MQELNWLEAHIGTLKKGIELANKFLWDIHIEETDQFIMVKGGEKTLFCADNHEPVDAFLYGLSLAYSVLPHSTVDQFKQEMQL